DHAHQEAREVMGLSYARRCQLYSSPEAAPLGHRILKHTASRTSARGYIEASPSCPGLRPGCGCSPRDASLDSVSYEYLLAEARRRLALLRVSFLLQIHFRPSAESPHILLFPRRRPS